MYDFLLPPGIKGLRINWGIYEKNLFNPFFPKLFWCFQGGQKDTLGRKELKHSDLLIERIILSRISLQGLKLGYLTWRIQSTIILNWPQQANICSYICNIYSYKYMHVNDIVLLPLRVLRVTISYFWKLCFSIRTSYKELIWCTNDTDFHIGTFCKHWSFIWGHFFFCECP